MSTKLSGLGELENQSFIYGELHKRGLQTIKELKEIANRPSYDKSPKTYTISEVERLLGISRVTIRDNEKKRNLKYSDSESITKKAEYRLNDISVIRDYFKKGFFNGAVKRPKSERPIVLAMGMFKGGVGKTTQSTHLAAYCAISGLKTCLIDTDPQGSATLTCGYIPSVDLNSSKSQ